MEKKKENKIQKPKKNEDKLKENIKKLKKELEEAQNDFLRTRADYENFRKRTQDEMKQTRERTIASFVESLLPAIDNFELSLKMTDNKEMFIKGVEMIHKNLLDTLKEHKIEMFEPKIGDSFDPIVHDPIAIEDNDKKKETGKVLAVVKKGYKHNDKILRPAKVQVKAE